MAQRDSSYKVEDGDVLQSFVENLTSEKPELSFCLSVFKQWSTIKRAVNNKLRHRILYTLHLKVIREAGIVLTKKGRGTYLLQHQLYKN